MNWRDLTYPFEPDSTHWPGQPPLTRERVDDLCCGAVANVSVVRTSVHTGTHIDAPLHFIADGADITHFPLGLSSGVVRVAYVDRATGHVGASDLEAYERRSGALQAGERLLLRTRNSARDWHRSSFDKTYCAIAPDAARLLVARQISLVGVDYLSVAPFDDPVTTHRTLLAAPVWPVEGLDLRHVDEGSYAYVCLPLPIAGADAAPCRFLLGAAC